MSFIISIPTKHKRTRKTKTNFLLKVASLVVLFTENKPNYLGEKVLGQKS
jgi:hypothetical protein